FRPFHPLGLAGPPVHRTEQQHQRATSGNRARLFMTPPSFQLTVVARGTEFDPSACTNVIRNVDPRPSTLFRSIRPPCASTAQRAMASPRPAPPRSRDRALSIR